MTLADGLVSALAVIIFAITVACAVWWARKG